MRRSAISAALALLVWAMSGSASSGAAVVGATAVESIGITVADLQRSKTFFQDVLSFTLEEEFESAGREVELLTGVFGARIKTARLRLGQETIELTEFLAPRGRPYPADTRGNDQWFQHIAIITSDMDAAYRRVRDRGVAHASTAPQRLPDWNADAGGIAAFYFRDPDGHFLELLQFPAGKGDRRWQEKHALMLGIDHTAIVSRDTDRSVRFYRDGLGLRIAGGAENHGVEQEHLNNVFGVRLRITTLKADRGPGVELLEYLAPRDGRPAPLDLKSNDLAHWHTTIAAVTPAALLQSTFGGWLVSPDSIVPPPAFRFASGLLVRDPDAHGVRVIAR
jgi:catechol 2,3-dioxygenase-like lactoylglutathione lyase family enzyme